MKQNNGGVSDGLAGLGLTAGAKAGGLDALGLTGSGSTTGPAGGNLAALLGGNEPKKQDNGAATVGASKSKSKDSSSKYVVNEEQEGGSGETDTLIAQHGDTGADKAAVKAEALAKLGASTKRVDQIIDKCLNVSVEKCPEKCCRPMNFLWSYEGQPLKL